MDDESMKGLLRNTSNMDICYALLGADGNIRRHMMGLLSKKHRFNLMEDLMDIPFSGDVAEKCMESMGRVIQMGAIMKREM